MTYKQTIYNYYRSSFKGESTDALLVFGAEKIKQVLQPWVNDIDTNLPAADLGCGAGELLLALKTLGFKSLSGCDLSAEQVKVASQSFSGVVHQDLFTYLSGHADGSFGLITVFDVIEHLTPQETFDLLSTCYKKLKPGGKFIAHLPNGLSPFVGHVYWGDMTHEWCLTPQSAKTLCLLHGFVDFKAAEHLGTSKNLKGYLRRIAWSMVRAVFKTINAIETGKGGGNVWTRNFAFAASKPF